MRVRITASTIVAWVVFASASGADEVTLINDGFVSGGPATFQGGFISGEIGAARFVPDIPCPCVLTRVTLLFGGSTESRDMGLLVWDDPGGLDQPGTLLFTGDVTLQGANDAFSEIDLSLAPIIVEGPFRVGFEFGHSGFPALATDVDGTIDADANFIEALVGGIPFWFQSAFLGVQGDFIIRATIDNFQVTDTDGDGVGDSEDNCTVAANPDQRDTDADGFGNACDPDFDNNCVVNAIDLGVFKSVFFTANADADFNGDGLVNAIDLGILRTLFFNEPGPSGLPNVCEAP